MFFMKRSDCRLACIHLQHERLQNRNDDDRLQDTKKPATESKPVSDNGRSAHAPEHSLNLIA